LDVRVEAKTRLRTPLLITKGDLAVYVDLHIHTCFSDGTQSPEEVAQIAKNQGLSAISICDHNTIAAYERLYIACKSLGLKLIPGAEIDVLWQNKRMHLLAYNFDFTNNAMSELLNSTKHKSGKCYPIEYACKIIRKANGVPIIAHPGVTWHEETDDLSTILESIKSTEIGGIECYYPWNTDDVTEICIDFCKQNNLCITCGCDGHGDENKKYMFDLFGVDYDIGSKKVPISLLNLRGIL